MGQGTGTQSGWKPRRGGSHHRIGSRESVFYDEDAEIKAAPIPRGDKCGPGTLMNTTHVLNHMEGACASRCQLEHVMWTSLKTVTHDMDAEIQTAPNLGGDKRGSGGLQLTLHPTILPTRSAPMQAAASSSIEHNLALVPCQGGYQPSLASECICMIWLRMHSMVPNAY